MSTLPRVAESTRERVAREFDDLGPDACIAEITAHLRESNPEWLYTAARYARDFGADAIRQLESGNPELLQMAHFFAAAQANYSRTMQGFALLYAALAIQANSDRLSVH